MNHPGKQCNCVILLLTSKGKRRHVCDMCIIENSSIADTFNIFTVDIFSVLNVVRYGEALLYLLYSARNIKFIHTRARAPTRTHVHARARTHIHARAHAQQRTGHLSEGGGRGELKSVQLWGNIIDKKTNFVELKECSNIQIFAHVQ